MQAGKLRHRVTIQTVTETEDQHGGVTESWADSFTIWANVEPLEGREFFDAQQQESTHYTHQITTRYRTDITTETRAKWGSRILDITAVINVEGRDRMLRLMCEEPT